MSTPKLSQSAVICVNYFIHFIRWRREGQKDGNSSKYSYRNVQAKLGMAQIVVFTCPLNKFLGKKNSSDSISMGIALFLYMNDCVYN